MIKSFGVGHGLTFFVKSGECIHSFFGGATLRIMDLSRIPSSLSTSSFMAYVAQRLPPCSLCHGHLALLSFRPHPPHRRPTGDKRSRHMIDFSHFHRE